MPGAGSDPDTYGDGADMLHALRQDCESRGKNRASDAAFGHHDSVSIFRGPGAFEVKCYAGPKNRV